MRLAFFSMELVIGLSPRAVRSAQIGPKVKSSAQGLMAGAASFLVAEFSRLKGEWSSTRIALEALCRGEEVAVLSQFGEQARGELLSTAWQRAKQVVIGILFKKLGDLLAVLV